MRLPQKMLRPGMQPCQEHGNHFFRYLSLGKEHLEYLVPEDGLQLFQSQRRRNTEHALFAIEAAIRDEDVAMRIESKKIAEGLYGDDGSGDRIILWNRFLEKDLQGFPGATAEVGKELSIVKKVARRIFGSVTELFSKGRMTSVFGI